MSLFWNRSGFEEEILSDLWRVKIFVGIFKTIVVVIVGLTTTVAIGDYGMHNTLNTHVLLFV